MNGQLHAGKDKVSLICGYTNLQEEKNFKNKSESELKVEGKQS